MEIVDRYYTITDRITIGLKISTLTRQMMS